jgi:hypothetical protein
MFAKDSVIDVWNQTSSFSTMARGVANVFVGVRSGERQYVQIVWEEWLQGIKMLQARVWQSRELASRASR